jgi:hypothetical protein
LSIDWILALTPLLPERLPAGLAASFTRTAAAVNGAWPFEGTAPEKSIPASDYFQFPVEWDDGVPGAFIPSASLSRRITPGWRIIEAGTNIRKA